MTSNKTNGKGRKTTTNLLFSLASPNKRENDRHGDLKLKSSGSLDGLVWLCGLKELGNRECCVHGLNFDLLVLDNPFCLTVFKAGSLTRKKSDADTDKGDEVDAF